jgi:hypothetical protein
MPRRQSNTPMGLLWQAACCATLLFCALAARAQPAPPQVVDIPTRPGVTQRFLYLAPAQPKAAVILYAGGHGGLHIYPNGSFAWGASNFLVRARQIFVDNGLAVAVVDAPGDHLTPPFLNGFRQTPEHAQDAQPYRPAGMAGRHQPRHAIGCCHRHPAGGRRRPRRHRTDLDHLAR